MDEDEQVRLLDFLDQPTLILEAGGRIRHANRSARSLLKCDPRRRCLAEFSDGPPDRIRTYISRCAGSGSSVIGSLALKPSGDPPVKLQVAGARLSARGQTPPLVALRLSPNRMQEFSILARHVDNLNLEIRKRRQAQEALERSLTLKEMLLHELHHRVKNQMQLLLAMLSVARRSSDDAVVSAFADSMSSRLRAMASAHELMYDADRLDTVPAKAFVRKLAESVSASWPDGAVVSFAAADTELRNDVTLPLALIVNELLTNALKHGLRFGAGRVKVELEQNDGTLRLSVRDDGPGMPEIPDLKRSSGLALVRGLCEQIGGSLEIARGEGACFTVQFPRS